MMHKKRYWDLAVFAVVSFLLFWILNAAGGLQGIGAVTYLWLIVAYYAVSGNIKAILSTTKVAIAIQVVVGAGITLWLANDRDAQNIFGDQSNFVIGVGIPTLVWVFVFFWAESKSDQGKAAQNAIKDSTAATADRSTDARTPPPLPTGDDNADEGKVTSDQRPDDDDDDDDDTFNVGDFPKALMAIGYRREAEEAWSQAQHLPTAYTRRFLEALDEDPKCDALEALSSVEEEFKKEQRPFDDEAANDALEEVRTISPDAVLEFKNVYETFGDTVPLPEIIQRIEANYGPSEETIARRKREQKIRRDQEWREQKIRLAILPIVLIILLTVVALWA